MVLVLLERLSVVCGIFNMALCELVLAEKPGLDKNLSPRDWQQLNTQGIFMEHKLNHTTTSIFFLYQLKP